LQFWSLNGITAYDEVRELQLLLVELRYQDLIPDTVLFLEHSDVVTRGRGLQFTGQLRERHIPLLQPIPSGMDLRESERGGDLTYHGPGQLVIYPIVKLDGSGFGPHHDIAGFLRRLESVLIAELGDFNLVADARENATGVWVGAKKIASAGIAVRKWVTYHGIALNCVNDLKPYHLISPCGFAPEVMTRLADLVEGVGGVDPIDGVDRMSIGLGGDWRARLENSIANRMAALGGAANAERALSGVTDAGVGSSTDGADSVRAVVERLDLIDCFSYVRNEYCFFNRLVR
jgi:lipoyl(octanoyl) transferase